MKYAFRLWNKYSKDFEQNFRIKSDGSIDLCFLKDDRATRNDLVLLQWTGITDKNGVKVFEGDIVHYTNYTSRAYGRETIFTVERGTDTMGFTCLDSIFPAHLKVMGNIFQHPELIKA